MPPSDRPTEVETRKPSDDQIEALREEMRELMGAVRECSRVVLEAKSAVSALSTKLNMVALAQLAGEAKGIGHDVAIREIRGDVAELFKQLGTAAE
jgi:hypothetical protein